VDRFLTDIVLQSAGSLSVAMLALMITVLQLVFAAKSRHLKWFVWSGALSFAAFVYAVGVFLEYNTMAGRLNRFAGLLEYTAIIGLIHCSYGFTFAYLSIPSKRYHRITGSWHAFILAMLWSSDIIVAQTFVSRDFICLANPFVESELGPLGLFFVLYASLAGVCLMFFWLKPRKNDPPYRTTFLFGLSGWLLLGIHDGLASLGVPTLQYFMEYGFLGFALVVLWAVFGRHLTLATEEKYRAITEFANDGILVVQDGKTVFANPACRRLIGHPMTNMQPADLLQALVPQDRRMVIERYNALIAGKPSDNFMIPIKRPDDTRRIVEVASSVINYLGKPALLGIMRDMTDRRRVEKERETLISELQRALAKVKSLSGLLPICAACKKIRDDKGYWNKIEAYIREHSDASFTHSICPECMQELYPDLAAESGRDKQTTRLPEK